MSISTLTKVNIFFHNENKDALIRRLQELACFHVIDFKETELARDYEDLVVNSDMTDLELEKRQSELGFAIECLSPFEKKSGMLSILVGKKVLLSKSEYNEILKTFDEAPVTKTVRALEKEEHALLSEIVNNEAVIRDLEPWKNLDVRVEDIADTNTVNLRLGKIPANKLANLRASIDKTTNLYDIHEINNIAESIYVMISYVKGHEDAIEEYMTIESFERKDFNAYTGKVSDIIEKYVAKDDMDDKRLANISTEYEKYAKVLPKMKVVYDHLLNMNKRKNIERDFGMTENISVLEGYVDVVDFPALKETMEREFKYLQMDEAQINEGETPPTKLKNSGVTQSFEIILDLYGMPAAKSFDSTKYLMPFFAIFFGLCLTDGGYGLLLVLFSLFMIKKYKPIFGNSKLVWVLLICGAATIVAGAITGGWFGDIIDKIAEPAKVEGVKYTAAQVANIKSQSLLWRMKESMVLFDPMNEPMVFFILSLALGYLHILFGLIMGFVKHVKDGELSEGFCTKFTWISFLVTLLLWILSMQGVIPAAMGATFKMLFILSSASIVIFSATGASNIFVRIASGLYNLYGASAYLGDLLSYLRLLALGLASGVIAVVINEMCSLVLGIPYVGIIAAALVFVGGHVFNLILSGLGAFVHTLRLNYVEFFPKFFVGGGKIFSPFKVESQYMIFNDEKNK